MITLEKLRSLKPGTNLYRVLASIKDNKPAKYRCTKATIEKVTVMYVMFIENTDAPLVWLKRNKIDWVLENMAISREGAWDQAAYDMTRAIGASENEVQKLTVAGIKMEVELKVILNRGKR